MMVRERYGEADRGLAAGCWLLVACCWLLVACCWGLGAEVFARQQENVSKAAAPEPDTKAATPDNTDSRPAENVVEMTDIHDIKDLEEIGVDLKPLYYILTGVLIVVILAVMFFFLRKLMKRKKQQQFVTLSPDDLALNLLDELLDIENINGKDFYFQLSAILRNYIEGRYGINAPEMTTEEFLPKIEQLDMKRELQQRLRHLLQSADPIKFAGVLPVQHKMQDDLMQTIDFVKQTRPSAIDEEVAAQEKN